jgi:long-subunit fatty acid transport protein
LEFNMHSARVSNRTGHTIGLCLLTGLFTAGGGGALHAQTNVVTSPPPNVVVPNYGGVPVGPNGGLESGAYTARADDPSAVWFNPAGLSRATGTQISGSAGLYELTSITPNSLENSGGSIQNLPNLVGFTLKGGSSLTLGLAVLTANSWTQEADFQGIDTSLRQRFAYSSDSDYSRRVLAIGAGYNYGGPWRLGAGLAVAVTSVRLVGSMSDRRADATTLRSLVVTSRATGSTLQINPIFGVQYDGVPHLRLGALVQTPAAAFMSSGVITQEGQFDVGTSSLGASVFDGNAKFEQHRPWEISGGAAYVAPRFEVEFDLHGYTSVSPYSLLSTSQPAAIYIDTPNQPPIVSTQPFTGFTTASRGIVNVAAGGHYRLRPDKSWLLHFGAASDRSPVAADDTVFTRVNLGSMTVGLSGTVAKLEFSAGFNYRAGTSDDIVFHNLADGSTRTTTVRVSTVGLIYSLAYTF